jgi:adenosylcobinamide-GDP ribazoletransferase
MRIPAPPSKGILSTFIPILAAFQFLLVTPAIIKRSFSDQELGRSVGFFPLVGAFLGLVLASTNGLLGFILPDFVRAAIVLGFWVLLTGALHLDGFLDACDGMFGGFSPENRLRIMRDEQIGAFAFAGGMILMLVKISAIASIKPSSLALILAPVLGRWAMSIAVVAFPYARQEGLGRVIKDHTGKAQAVIATVITLIIVVGLGFYASGLLITLSVAAAVIASYICIRFSLSRLPGLTGDLYGAICEVTETCVLIGLSIIYF